METKHKGSRTYCVTLSHPLTGDRIMMVHATYKGAQGYLDYHEHEWKSLGLEVSRTRTELSASGELAGAEFSAKIWFVENK